jgi:hypothetical protein
VPQDGPPQSFTQHQEKQMEGSGVTPRPDEDAEFIGREWKNSRGEHVYR